MTSIKQALAAQSALITGDQPSQAIPRRKRQPILTQLWLLLAPILPGLWRRARSGVLQVAGLGFLCWAAWMIHPAAGAAVIGVSLLVLEVLMRGDE